MRWTAKHACLADTCSQRRSGIGVIALSNDSGRNVGSERIDTSCNCDMCMHMQPGLHCVQGLRISVLVTRCSHLIRLPSLCIYSAAIILLSWVPIYTQYCVSLDRECLIVPSVRWIGRAKLLQEYLSRV